MPFIPAAIIVLNKTKPSSLSFGGVGCVDILQLNFPLGTIKWPLSAFTCKAQQCCYMISHKHGSVYWQQICGLQCKLLPAKLKHAVKQTIGDLLDFIINKLHKVYIL